MFGFPSGGGRIVACLKQHQNELSDTCRKAGGLPPRANTSQPTTPAYAASAAGSNTLADAAAMPAHTVEGPLFRHMQGGDSHVAVRCVANRPTNEDISGDSGGLADRGWGIGASRFAS